MYWCKYVPDAYTHRYRCIHLFVCMYMIYVSIHSCASSNWNTNTTCNAKGRKKIATCPVTGAFDAHDPSHPKDRGARQGHSSNRGPLWMVAHVSCDIIIMYMYICVCIDLFFFELFTYLHVYIYLYIHIYIYSCIDVFKYVYVYINIYDYICLYIFIYICVCVCCVIGLIGFIHHTIVQYMFFWF